jgi:hypothetical protein
MSATDANPETVKQIAALELDEELVTTVAGTTWVVRREDGRTYRLTRMAGYLIDAVVELSNVSTAEVVATMAVLSAQEQS